MGACDREASLHMQHPVCCVGGQAGFMRRMQEAQPPVLLGATQAVLH